MIGTSAPQIVELIMSDIAIHPLDPAVYAAQIHQIMYNAYTIEAQLLGAGEDFYPLTRPLTDIATSPNRFIGYFKENQLLGVCELEPMEEGALLIASTVVSPKAFRHGIASAMLRYILEQHANQPIWVSTAQDNHPAVRLYQKHGFIIQHHTTLPDGMVLVKLRST
ncbi:MAG: GNAT family N-acetyltransferase [Anaerolineales bacterium]|nr:GNAT family N-acetyltransferase [Anaerolineales bacterium]